MNQLYFGQLKKSDKYIGVLDNYINNKSQIVHGLSEEGLAYLCNALNDDKINQILIITYDDIKAKKLEDIIKTFGTNAERFLSKQFILYNIDAHSRDVVNKRIQVLEKITNNEKIIVVASIKSLISKIMPKDRFKKHVLNLEYNKDYDFNKLIKDLIFLGYERVDYIEGAGQFAVRGGIIDIFSPDNINPYRIEFFGEEIDSIRFFDAKNQRSIRNIDSAKICPCSDLLIDDKELIEVRKGIERDYTNRLNKIVNSDTVRKVEDKIKKYYGDFLVKIEENMLIDNIDLLTPYTKSNYDTLIDYFEKEYLIVLDEPNRINEDVKNIKQDFLSRYTELFSQGEILTKQKDIYFDYKAIINKVKENPYIIFNSILKNNHKLSVNIIEQIQSKEANIYYSNIESLSKALNDYKYKGYKTTIVLNDKEKCEKLFELLNEYECTTSITYDENDNAKSGQVVITKGNLKKGFELLDNKILFLTESEVYGKYKKKIRKSKKKKSSKIESFTDLKPGDYVVHEHHGIGQFIGIEKMVVQQIKKDYLCIKYKGKDKLFVPIDQMSLIQKYIGSDAVKPKVNKMDSTEWVKTKAKTQKAIENMAAELVQLYAKRQMTKGYAFSSDTQWQKEFEDKFPFEETDDQLRCIAEIKNDMESLIPMDRLLCGDVGFGKTEVAIRAAFKAIMDSKQVAFLVPTTILAQQHYSNMVERFEGYPIKIEMLSRFRTPAQQRKIINDLNAGLIDVIVGTHRMLSKDIKINKLGLLVIDEEQRFGVKHKEKIKQLKTTVDVLTLTATPIPRTLHMSMIGIRDMSLIEEPPGERFPIQTYVLEYNDGIVKDAIVNELSRGGQVYYVHNKVMSIEQKAAEIKKMVPDARIAIGHGQMGERHLENIMIDFIDNEYDILICTTIIETGMDISNVNTMIIDNADQMGLSQLYQLRGRVGRSNKIAFAYLTYQKNKVLSEIADKRLKAIKEFTEFGSGFKIAMRDLEIRGSGNILGSEQHGHMADIGYDLYVKFLERAVRKIRGEGDDNLEAEISVDLNVDGYIPTKYISDEEQKIEVYKKIAAISNKNDVLDTTEEIIDRFGETPKEVNNLLKIAYIKVLCSKLAIKSILQINKTVNIEFSTQKDLTSEIISFILSNYKNKIKFDVSKKPIIRYKLDNIGQAKVLKELENMIESIYNFITK